MATNQDHSSQPMAKPIDDETSLICLLVTMAAAWVSIIGIGHVLAFLIGGAS